MHKFLGLILLVTVVSLVGCKSEQAKQVADAPPPPPVDNLSSYPTDTAAPLAVPSQPMPAMDAMGGAPTAGSTYVIQKGDTLWSIAKRVYGDGKRWSDIARANNLDPKKLPVGQKITLP
ncbi:MAG: LysM peptidoglycan-binding domain-containing protein [Phycisphaeraceae bacterium]|nr:LysM peptidoglycan-binding domain-containing protein [Phycisphaeraceae bacterium]